MMTKGSDRQKKDRSREVRPRVSSRIAEQLVTYLEIIFHQRNLNLTTVNMFAPREKIHRPLDRPQNMWIPRKLSTEGKCKRNYAHYGFNLVKIIR